MSYIEIAKDVFNLEIEELQKVKHKINDEFDKVIDMIFNSSGKVVITGIGKSGIIGRKISASLSSTGTVSVFMNAAEGVHGDLGMIEKDDIVIVISNSGNSNEVINLLGSIRVIGAKIIAMTSNSNSKLAKSADVVVDVGVDNEVCPMNLAPTSSTTATLVMGDALVVSLMKKRNFNQENFALYHPGGIIGKRLLTRVKDLINRDIAKIYIENDIRIVLSEMISKRMNLALVVDNNDNPVGVISDGDIKRSIFENYKNIESIKAKDIMNEEFKYIDESETLIYALKKFEKDNISALVVMKDEIIEGIISMKDIVDFGL